MVFGNIISSALVFDLYQIPHGANEAYEPTRLVEYLRQPVEMWLVYGVSTMVTVVGAILLGSVKYDVSLLVAFIMIPIAGLISLVASPLRLTDQRLAIPIAYLYF